MNKKKTIAIIAILLIIAILIGGIFAYFKDTDEVTNVFTIGNIDITLHENAAWVASGNIATNDSAINLTPGAEIAKTPYVSNDSTSGNPAYIFLKVTVPVGDVDGDASTTAEQLFSYDVADEWTLVAQSSIAASTGELAKNVYVYAYGTGTTMTSVPAGAAGAAEGTTNATTSVFDTVVLNENITSEGLEAINIKQIKSVKRLLVDEDIEGKFSPGKISYYVDKFARTIVCDVSVNVVGFVFVAPFVL